MRNSYDIYTLVAVDSKLTKAVMQVHRQIKDKEQTDEGLERNPQFNRRGGYVDYKDFVHHLSSGYCEPTDFEE